MESENSETISIGEFLRFTLKSWWLSAIIILAGVIGAATYVKVTPAEYKSSASIMVLGDTKQQGLSRDIAIGNYIALMTSNRVLSDVEMNQPNLDLGQIRNGLSVTRGKNSEIVNIEYSSSDPNNVSSVITSVISSFQEVVSDMYGVPEDGVNTISAPVDSGKPVNKDYLKPVLMGFAGGLAVALVVSFLRFDAKQRKTEKPKKATEEDKRLQRKIARDAETVRKQKLRAELKAIDADATEADARANEAKLRIAQIDLDAINTEVEKVKKQLEVVETEKKLADVKIEKARVLAKTAELELESTINEINVKEEKKIARNQSLARRRASRVEARINRKADLEIIRIRAEKRIESEKATIAKSKPSITPPESPVPTPPAPTNTSLERPATPDSLQSSILKRPLGGDTLR